MNLNEQLARAMNRKEVDYLNSSTAMHCLEWLVDYGRRPAVDKYDNFYEINFAFGNGYATTEADTLEEAIARAYIAAKEEA